ncbi:zf-HC2 domain-containing protein [Paenibacillus pini]|uniref:Putative zinc-finger domain-containing protein n=1 Tax=Paenibacillus pini JCM 16418 TaxID=1236976 RepID=W7Z4A2_9BACL|nr:zf-HC2 domain-containing protein [Paenibacillus pini]GAF09184.1 hypothetical protein JCM16418_3304 [Paenibacillus pini JCM 16418]
MKCDIVRDLLPSYIENLTSPSSNEEIEQHLTSCEHCRQFHQEMTGIVNENVPAMNNKEIENLDYLKKVRTKNKKTLLISISAVLIVTLVIISFFAIPVSVSSQDVTLSYEKTNTRFKVELSLTNGKDLVFSGKSMFIYDENKNVIGYENRYVPKELLHNPFDNVETTIVLGTEISTENSYPSSFVLEFKDKTMTFVNGVLVK